MKAIAKWDFFCLFVPYFHLNLFGIKVIAKWDLTKSCHFVKIFCQIIVLAWEPDFGCGMRADFVALIGGLWY